MPGTAPKRLVLFGLGFVLLASPGYVPADLDAALTSTPTPVDTPVDRTPTAPYEGGGGGNPPPVDGAWVSPLLQAFGAFLHVYAGPVYLLAPAGDLRFWPSTPRGHGAAAGVGVLAGLLAPVVSTASGVLYVVPVLLGASVAVGNAVAVSGWGGERAPGLVAGLCGILLATGVPLAYSRWLFADHLVTPLAGAFSGPALVGGATLLLASRNWRRDGRVRAPLAAVTAILLVLVYTGFVGY